MAGESRREIHPGHEVEEAVLRAVEELLAP